MTSPNSGSEILKVDSRGRVRTTPQRRTNNALVQTFGVNQLNQLTNISRSGTFTLAGRLTVGAALTINGATNNYQPYDDLTFAKEGLTLSNAPQTFTIIATNATFHSAASNSVTVYMPTSINYTYDLNGNLTSDGIRSYSFNAENQLTQIHVTNQWKSNFSYDGLGRRRVRTEATWSGSAWMTNTTVRYIYDGMLVIQERDGSNAWKVSYTRGRDLSGTLQGAGGVGGLIARTENTSYVMLSPGGSKPASSGHFKTSQFEAGDS